MSGCPSENALIELAEGARTGPQAAALVAHVDGCAPCRQLLVALLGGSPIADRSPPRPALRDPALADTAALTPPLDSARAPARAPAGGRFELLRLLGSGGMGVVYEARDHRHGTIVALKTLQHLSPEGLMRFKHEFRALCDLRHPNLVSLEELFEEQGRLWLVMERVRGVDLLSYVRPSGSLDEGRLRQVLPQVAQGLCALHAAGKVHRDVKPQNVLVTTEGRAVILDFGLVLDVAESLSGAHLVGTISYMAPEQGGGAVVGPAADWYSLGVMLYEALTGAVPFSGAPLQILRDKAQRDVSPPPGGVPTLADLEALCAALLRCEPSRRAGEAEVLRALHPQASPPPPPLPIANTRLFVGREAELSRLRRALDEVLAGAMRSVCIEGVSGVGKSALARRFAEELMQRRPDAVVLSGRCYEHEDLPFKALDGVVDALSRHLRRLPAAEVAVLVPRWVAVLRRAFPVLGRVPGFAEAAEAPAREAEQAPDLQEARQRVFASLRELLVRIAERRPLLLCIDDLQWTDVDSMSALLSVLSPPDPPPLLLLCTRRRAAPPLPGPPEAAALLCGTAVVLSPLPVAEAEELARQLLRQLPENQGAAEDPGQAAALAAEAGGHPLFLDVLVRHAARRLSPAAHLPARLDDALWERMDAMGEPARRLLTSACVAGRPLPAAVLAQAAAVPDEERAPLAEALCAARLLRSTLLSGDEAMEPYHDRVRESVLGRLGPGELRRQHGRLAAALQERGAADPMALALHYQEAGDTPRAAAALREAALQARAALAFQNAAALYQRALALGQRALALGVGAPDELRELRAGLAECLAGAGMGQDAAREYLAAAQGAAPLLSLERRFRAGDQLMRSGLLDESLRILVQVLRELGLRPAPRGFLALLLVLWQRALIRVLLWRQPAASPGSDRERLRLDLSQSLAIALTSVNFSEQGAAFLGRYQILALRSGAPRHHAMALLQEALGEVGLSGRITRRAAALLSRAAEACERGGDLRPRAWLHMVEAAGQLMEGRWRRSCQSAAEAEALFRQGCTGAWWEISTARFYALAALSFLGEARELGRQMPALLREAAERGDKYTETALYSGGTILYWVAEDRAEEALERAAELFSRWSQQERTRQQLFHALGQAQLLHYLRGGRAAHEFLEGQLRALLPRLLLRLPFFRLWLLFLRCFMLIAAAAEERPSRARERRLAWAERMLRGLRRSPIACAGALAAGLRALIAAVRGDPAMLALLREALWGFEEAELGLHAACARRRLGEVLGGDEGRALTDQADRWLAAQGFRAPTRVLAYMTPGFMRLA